MLLSRDLMLRKWILQVGSAPPSALTSPAHQPMQLACNPLGSSKERVLCPVVCHVAFGPLPCLSLFRRAFHLWQRMKNTACAKTVLVVIFNITVFIITTVISLSGLALCLGLSVCSLIKTHARLKYSDTLVTVGSHSYWHLQCCFCSMTGWPPVSSGFLDTWWYFIFARCTFSQFEREGAL